MDQHIRRARDLDPTGPAVLMNTIQIQVLAGEFEAAREVAERFAAQHPDVPVARALVGHAYLAEGRPEEALARFRALEGQIPGVQVLEAMALARASRGSAASTRAASREPRWRRALALCHRIGLRLSGR